ncbi:MAG: O-antigen ligase family protein [Gaiellaceae bacterium]
MSTAPAPPGVTEIDDSVMNAKTDGSAALARAAPSIAAGLALVGVGIFGVWTVNDGGFAPEQWLPGALVMLGLLLTSLASADVRARLRARPAAPLLLGLYVIWSYASILWAQVRGDALDGANRTLLYFCVYVLFSGLPLGERGRVVVVSCWGFAIAVIGGVELVLAAATASPQGHFVLGRLASPITYSNANAAVFLISFLPLQVLASRREGHPVLRIAAGGACAVLVDLAVLGESRGSLVALPLALVLYLAVGRNLLRALPQLAVVALAVAPAVPRLLAVYSAVVDGRGYASTLSSACAWVGVSALIAAAGSGILAVIDRRVRVPERVCVMLRRATLAAAATALVVAAVGFLAVGHPAARATQAWDDFTTNKKAPPQTVHIVSGVGTSRYDVWRIALRQFATHPLGGVGADNYLVGYLEQRRTSETSRYPQSIELRALSETGIVGAVLFFGFLGVALRRAVAAARRGPVPTAALACLVGSGYWMFHASVDWLWEFPALAGPALALLGLAGGALACGVRERRPEVRTGRIARLALVAGTAALAAAAAAALAAPWVAVRQIDRAVAVAATTPDRASALLRAAASWNRLSDAAALTEATLAANAEDRVRERRALRAALARNGSNWYAYLMLGIVAGQEHRPAAARANLARARRLSPLDPVVVYAQRRLRWGTPLTEREVGRIFRLTTRTLRGVVQR